MQGIAASRSDGVPNPSFALRSVIAQTDIEKFSLAGAAPLHAATRRLLLVTGLPFLMPNYRVPLRLVASVSPLFASQ